MKGTYDLTPYKDRKLIKGVLQNLPAGIYDGISYVVLEKMSFMCHSLCLDMYYIFSTQTLETNINDINSLAK